ncbi:hypothetical protein [Flavobacterium turcicum]|uniref:Lysine transporter LysE n=1 Tax=Flavobacterium turcicum TaxID=2764718 RepID=A0ABR7JHZ2_9FLAO|nr:hypothetical protein [Flavobacterium turcicum]MBC5864118.1 hypothetical protein [Flavobacterium turcicum]NHL03024.1 hypothetical protein [Flavobacterium turcicum]
MKIVKNILVGFLVSFVGSIPLGYLNLVGFEIHRSQGLLSLIWFLLGVVLVEGFVIFYTLKFAQRLVENLKLMRYIDYFAILFLLLIGYSFYAGSQASSDNQSVLGSYLHYYPFLIGVFLSAINFLQIPFWTGWNLYLMNGNYISVGNKLKLFYIAGTLLGTFSGMLALILVLNQLSTHTSDYSSYIFPVIIPLFFLVLALFQVVKVYKKYHKKESTTL